MLRSASILLVASKFAVGCACLLLSATFAHSQSTLHTVKQTIADARLVEVTAQNQLQFQHGEQTSDWEPHQIVRWTNQVTTTPGPAVAGLDGSWLAGQIQWPDRHKIKLISKWFEPVELDLDNLRAVLTNPSPSWSETQSLQDRMLTVSGSRDMLWKRSTESTAGIVTIQLKKSIDAASPDRVVWNFQSQASDNAVELSSSDLAGVTFSPILRRSLTGRPTSIHMNLRDGSRLVIDQLVRRADGRVECSLASGLKLVSLDEADEFVRAIAQVTSRPPAISWLSELEPARYRLLESESKVPWPLGRDQDLFGQRLFDTQGTAIEHALVIHAPAQAAYRWDGKPARLMASLEIWQTPASGSNADPLGSAQAQILVARNGQLTQVWQSAIIRTGEAPVEMDIDVSNAQLIVLLVDSADLGSRGDHLLWRDVRLVTP